MASALWYPAAILAIAVLKAVTHLRDIDLRVATYAVSSPLGFIALHLNPEMSAVDWPAGSADFRLSLPMNLLLWLVQTTGIEPEGLLWPWGFLQIVGFLAATAYLAHALFADRAATLAIVCVVAVSPVAGVNLGNFGAGIGNNSPVLFYTAANALKLLALALFLKGRTIGAAVAAALALHTHLTIGLFMVAFIAAGVFADPRRWLNRRLIVAGCLFAAMIAPLAVTVSDSNVSTTAIATDDWVFMSRLFNWHWHPIETGLFGPFAAIGVFPLAVLMLAYVLARRNCNAREPRVDRFLLAGMMISLVLTGVGIVLSEIVPTPVVMKLALQRSSELVSLICTFYFVADLVRRMRSAGAAQAFVAAWSLMLMIVATAGLALAPLLILAAADARRAGEPRLFGACAALILVLLVLSVVESIAAGRIVSLDPVTITGLQKFVAALWTPLQHVSPLLVPDYLLLGGSIPDRSGLTLMVAFAVVAAIASRIRSGRAVAGGAALSWTLLIAGGLGIYVVQDARWEAWARDNRERASAYKEAQSWASRSTPAAALFMGDPGFTTGWREYSRRAYFGGASELAHFGTLYDSVPGLFERGIDRVREFGTDPLSLDRAAITLPGGGKFGISVLAPRMSERFNSMRADELMQIARRHGVDFVIIERARRTQPLAGLSPSHENAYYRIYAVPPG